MKTDIFTDDSGKPKILYGCSINSGSTRAAELAASLGFDVIWIEMEHTSADLRLAEGLCVAAQAGGALPLIRAAGSERDQILHALEVGGRIIVIPMTNTAQIAQTIVRYGKFAPLGRRGYNTRSRAAKYGIEQFHADQMNRENLLFPQIETLEAIHNIDAILDVEGLGGIFIGPGDLSVDLGSPGHYENPVLVDHVCKTIQKARKRGLHAGILVEKSPLLDQALEAGADLCVIASDLSAMIKTWREALKARGVKSKKS
jgi:4-hydroxy-2-oxoheptanedioate aldolase